jgi:type I restriction enzyme S subunit
MNFPRYPGYKDSGVVWLGEVPAHWDVSEIKRLAYLQSGESITSDSIEGEGDFPVFGGGGQRGFTSAFTHDGDFVLIGRQGALCGNVSYGRGKFWASEHSVVATPIKQLDTVWLGELLRAMNLNQYSVSAAQPGLSVDVVKRLKTCVPPPDEQAAIAQFLSRETAKIDELVSEQRRLMELLQEKRQAVVSQAVTKGLNPDAHLRASSVEWLGDVPAHWPVTRLGNVFREVAEAGTDELPILSVSIHNGVSDKEIADEEMERKVSRSEDRSTYKKVRPGDLVYNMMRAWQGGFGTVTVEGMVSPAYVVARPRSRVVTAYVEHLLRTPQAIEQMRRHSRGVTDFRLRLYWDEFKNIRIALPPESESAGICEEISRMDRQFDALSESCDQAIKLLTARRSALISAAVTGQIDIRGSSAPTKADLTN